MQSNLSHAKSVRPHDEQDEHEPSLRPLPGLAPSTPSGSRFCTCMCRRVCGPSSPRPKSNRLSILSWAAVGSRLCGAWRGRFSGMSTTCGNIGGALTRPQRATRRGPVPVMLATADRERDAEFRILLNARLWAYNSCTRSCRRRLHRHVTRSRPTLVERT